MDCRPPGSSVHGILQARILEWVAVPSSRGSSQPSFQTCVSNVSCIDRWVLYRYHHLGSRSECRWKKIRVWMAEPLGIQELRGWDEKMLVSQLCPTLWDPIDCSLPGSSVCGILQAKILEWAAIPFSRGSSQPRDQSLVSCIAGRFFTEIRRNTQRRVFLLRYNRDDAGERASWKTQEGMFLRKTKW